MGIFKKKAISNIHDGDWGHLVTVHNIDVDTLSKHMRCVEGKGVWEKEIPVTFVRIFRLGEVQDRGIIVTGWEAFDQNPDLILFEEYLTKANDAYSERRK